MNFVKKTVSPEGKIELHDYLPAMGIGPVRQEILNGLLATPKRIASKFFYDAAGSELFEEITRLEEYYPTRTEKSILAAMAGNLEVDFKGLNLIELGSGDASKISLLLRQIPGPLLKTVHYFPMDISRPAIEKSGRELLQKFELKQITGVVADFYHQMHVIPKVKNRLFCFFGSTIGNFTESLARDFMFRLGNTLQKGDGLLLGVDMVKDAGVLERAYNDEKGVTARFNKNILRVVNRLINTDFDPEVFEHVAFFNKTKNRIEMHLRAMTDMEISLERDRKIVIRMGETIHTENSQKFTPSDIKKLARWASLDTVRLFSDEKNWFTLAYLVKR